MSECKSCGNTMDPDHVKTPGMFAYESGVCSLSCYSDWAAKEIVTLREELAEAKRVKCDPRFSQLKADVAEAVRECLSNATKQGATIHLVIELDRALVASGFRPVYL